jgi:hypothetical protein
VAEAFWDAAGGRGAYDHALHQFIGWNAWLAFKLMY